MSNRSEISEIEIRDRSNEELEIDLLELFGHFMNKLKWIVAGFMVGALMAGPVTHLL